MRPRNSPSQETGPSQETLPAEGRADWVTTTKGCCPGVTVCLPGVLTPTASRPLHCNMISGDHSLLSQPCHTLTVEPFLNHSAFSPANEDAATQFVLLC